jgi:hypothetical protein
VRPYPHDPEGPVGPQYPEGHKVFIWLFVLGLIWGVTLLFGGR